MKNPTEVRYRTFQLRRELGAHPADVQDDRRRELRPQERLVERHALEAVAHEEVRGEDRARGDVLLKNIYVVLTFF